MHNGPRNVATTWHYLHKWKFFEHLCHIYIYIYSFFSCPEQLNRWPCHSVCHSLTVLLLLTLQSDPRDLWPLRHLFRVKRRHALTEKKPTYPPTYLPNFFSTFVQLSSTFPNFSSIFFLNFFSTLFLTFPQLFSNCPSTFSRLLSTFCQLFLRFFLHPKGAIIGTCDIWDTDYNTDNWEPGFMTIFVTFQLIVTLCTIKVFLTITSYLVIKGFLDITYLSSHKNYLAIQSYLAIKKVI